MHTMRIRVVNKKIEVAIDDEPAPMWFNAEDCAAEGYIALTTNMNSGRYANLSITQLDYSGNPVKLGSAFAAPEDENWKPDNDAFGSNLTEESGEPQDVGGNSSNGSGNNVNTGVEPATGAFLSLAASLPIAAVSYKKRKRKLYGFERGSHS